MIRVLVGTWALFLGLLLLMLGNGMQGTLLGIRGGIEGFGTFEMSVVMSSYFVGFLGGSRLAPEMIRRVGHVRVFAALGSMISAVLILYPALTEIWTWSLLRLIIGFCFSGVYVTAESWLNNSVDNANRGQALSLYLIVQMAGVTAAQGLVALGDPAGFILFIIPSVLVSISFAPILLSVQPTPAFETTRPMSLGALYKTSPLGCVSIFLLGGVFSAQFGMSAVYAAETGLSVARISAFVSGFYIGGLLMQYPLGWLSDRMDRRRLIMIVAFIGACVAVMGVLFGEVYSVLLVVAFFTGGLSNPLYALAIAYTNDFLEVEDMASASGGLIFLNGLGAIAGPLVTGAIMARVGPQGFWLFVAVLMFAIGAYALWRMSQRPSTSTVEDTVSYAPVLQTASPVVVEVAQEIYAEHAEDAAQHEDAESTHAH